MLLENVIKSAKQIQFVGLPSEVVTVDAWIVRQALKRGNDGTYLKDEKGRVIPIPEKVEFFKDHVSIPANSEWAAKILNGEDIKVFSYGTLFLSENPNSLLAAMIQQAAEELGYFPVQVSTAGAICYGVNYNTILELFKEDVNVDKLTALNNASRVATCDEKPLVKVALIEELTMDGQAVCMDDMFPEFPSEQQHRARYLKHDGTWERGYKFLLVSNGDLFLALKERYNISEDVDIIMSIENFKKKVLRKKVVFENGIGILHIVLEPIAVQDKSCRAVKPGSGLLFSMAKGTSELYRSQGLDKAQSTIIKACNELDIDSFHTIMRTFSDPSFNKTTHMKPVRLAASMFEIPSLDATGTRFGKWVPNMARGSRTAFMEACGHYLDNAEKLVGCITYAGCDIRLDKLELAAKEAGEKRSFVILPKSSCVWTKKRKLTMKEATLEYNRVARLLHPLVGAYSLLEVALVGRKMWKHFIETGEYQVFEDDIPMMKSGRTSYFSEQSQAKAMKDFDGDKVIIMFYRSGTAFQPAKFWDLGMEVKPAEETDIPYVAPTNKSEVIDQMIKLYNAIWFGEASVGAMSVACRKSLLKRLVLEGNFPEEISAWLIYFMEVRGAKAMKSNIQSGELDLDAERKLVSKKLLKGVSQENLSELQLNFQDFLYSLYNRNFSNSFDDGEIGNEKFFYNAVNAIKRYNTFRTSWTDGILNDYCARYVMFDQLHTINLPNENNQDAAMVKRIAIKAKELFISTFTDPKLNESVVLGMKSIGNLVSKAFDLSRKASKVSRGAKGRTLNILFAEDRANLALIIRELKFTLDGVEYKAPQLDMTDRTYATIQDSYRVNRMIMHWLICRIANLVPNWDTCEVEIPESGKFPIQLGAMQAMITSWGHIISKQPSIDGDEDVMETVYTGHLFAQFPAFAQHWALEHYYNAVGEVSVKTLYPDANVSDSIKMKELEGYTVSDTLAKVIETFKA